VSRLSQRTARIKIFLHGGIIPIGEVGNEVQQRESQDVPVCLLPAVQPGRLGKRLPSSPDFLIAPSTEFLAVGGSTCKFENDFCCLVSEILRTERIGWIWPKRCTNHRTAGSKWPTSPPNM
jgi:hypothetical protein